MSEPTLSPDNEESKVDDQVPAEKLGDVAGGMSGGDPMPANEGGGFAAPVDVNW